MSSSPSLENRFTRDVESNDGPNGTDSDGDADTFHIPGKKAPVERLRRWRRAALVLNATRRFRYTLDLKKEEEKNQTTRKIRAHAQAIRAAFLFKEAGRSVSTGASEEFPPARGFGIGCERLAALTREHDTSSLREHGGVEGLANLLKTDLDKGIPGDDSETLVQRREAFGSNTYPRKMGKSFWVFLWEAFQDKTLIALMVAVALSLGFGIKSEGIKEGWYDGASIAFAVLLVVLVTASSDYKQSLQFQGLNEEKRNIKLEVVRGGRRNEVSIFDLVVGDVVPLNIGDQIRTKSLFAAGGNRTRNHQGAKKLFFKSPSPMGVEPATCCV